MKKKFKLVAILLTLILSVSAVTVYGLTVLKTAWVPDASLNLPNPSFSFKTVTIDGKSMDYILQMPRVRNFDGAGIDSPIKYPVLISLHGSGAESFLERYRTETMPDGVLLDHVSKSYEFPFISIHPLMPNFGYGSRNAWKSMEAFVMKAYEDTAAAYSIDPSRVYVTGFSLGGYGTYDYAMDFPNMFAACVVGAGSANIKDAPRLAKIPFWIFHGIGDFTVSFDQGKAMAEELQYQTSEKNVIFTQLPVGHELTGEVYCESTFNWMLSKTLRTDTVAPLAPSVNSIYSNSTWLSGTISDELGSKVIAKVGTKVLGFGYVDGHEEFGFPIAKQAIGTTVTITVMDAFKNVGAAKNVVVKLNPIPTKPVIKTASTTKVTGTAQTGCKIVVKIGTKTIATGLTNSSGAFSVKYKALKIGTAIKLTSTKNGKTSAAVTVKVK